MTSPPADVVAPLVWYERDIPGDGFFIEAFANPEAHLVPCEVYWGSHGCARPHGHDGDCWCDCCECEDHPDHDSGCVAGPPYYGSDTHFYGDHAAARGLVE